MMGPTFLLFGYLFSLLSLIFQTSSILFFWDGSTISYLFSLWIVLKWFSFLFTFTVQTATTQMIKTIAFHLLINIPFSLLLTFYLWEKEIGEREDFMWKTIFLTLLISTISLLLAGSPDVKKR
jgi:hypothetical protein